MTDSWHQLPHPPRNRNTIRTAQLGWAPQAQSTEHLPAAALGATGLNTRANPRPLHQHSIGSMLTHHRH